MTIYTPLKIAFDARFYNEAGPGRYVKNILSHLEELDDTNTYYVLLRSKSYEEYRPTRSNFVRIKADYSWYSFKEQTLFLLKLLTLNADILYVPHFNIPIFYPRTLITAVPDIIMHTFSTEMGTTLPKNYFKLKKIIYKLVTHWAMLRSTNIIVPSQATADDITTVFGAKVKRKLVLAPEGIDPDINTTNVSKDKNRLLERLKITNSFILYVGSMYEHKNLIRLIDSYQVALSKGLKHQLVIAGKADLFSKRIEEYVKKRGISQHIILPGQSGRLNDTEVNTLRQNCQFYIFPSLKEGFSLTPLECMAFDKPCLISDIPCHREIYRDSVLYFDPFEINDITNQILKLDGDTNLKEILVNKGRELTQEYSWNNTAKITLATFSKLNKRV
jgi:glycosyltransferase involved in cell wall biosynthesis